MTGLAPKSEFLVGLVVDSKLVDAWIALANSDTNTPEHAEHFWVFGRVWQLVHDEPQRAWEFILAVLKTDHSARVVQNLAAGRLKTCWRSTLI